MNAQERAASKTASDIAYGPGTVEERVAKLNEFAKPHMDNPAVTCYFEMLEDERSADERRKQLQGEET